MTDPTIDPRPEPPPKVDPEELTLRARPQAVTRINRRVLIGAVTLGSVLIFGALRANGDLWSHCLRLEA